MKMFHYKSSYRMNFIIDKNNKKDKRIPSASILVSFSLIP